MRSAKFDVEDPSGAGAVSLLTEAFRVHGVFERNIEGAPLESVLTLVASARTAVKDRSPLRGAPLVPHSASLTASSLRLRFFHRGAGAPRVFVALNSYFMNFPWSRKVMLPQKNRALRIRLGKAWPDGPDLPRGPTPSRRGVSSSRTL